MSRVLLPFVLLAIVVSVPAQFEIDCSSASNNSRCSNISNVLGCVAGPISMGCIATSTSCTNCFFAGPSLDDRASGQLALVIADPGPYEEYGLQRLDVLYRINRQGLQGGEDFSKINELRQQGDVVLIVLRRNYPVIVRIPQH